MNDGPFLAQKTWTQKLLGNMCGAKSNNVVSRVVMVSSLVMAYNRTVFKKSQLKYISVYYRLPILFFKNPVKFLTPIALIPLYLVVTIQKRRLDFTTTFRDM